MTDWTDFAVVTGGATAALLGLLFVAVSLRIETIARSAELLNRSAQTLALLLTGLLAATFITVPDQDGWILGAELLALAAASVVIAIVLDRRAGSQSGSRLARVLDATNPTTITCALPAAAGITLILGSDDGLYLLVPALVAVLVGGVLNAWLILVRLTEPPRA